MYSEHVNFRPYVKVNNFNIKAVNNFQSPQRNWSVTVRYISHHITILIDLILSYVLSGALYVVTSCLSSKISLYKNTESGIITVSYDFNATYTRASKRLVTDVILFCQAPLVLGVLWLNTLFTIGVGSAWHHQKGGSPCSLAMHSAHWCLLN